MPSGRKAIRSSLVFGHAGKRTALADFREQSIQAGIRLLADDVRVDGEPADSGKPEKEACPALEDELKSLFRQGIEEGKGVNRFFKQDWIAAAEFRSLPFLPFGAKAFWINHARSDKSIPPNYHRRN